MQHNICSSQNCFCFSSIYYSVYKLFSGCHTVLQKCGITHPVNQPFIHPFTDTGRIKKHYLTIQPRASHKENMQTHNQKFIPKNFPTKLQTSMVDAFGMGWHLCFLIWLKTERWVDFSGHWNKFSLVSTWKVLEGRRIDFIQSPDKFVEVLKRCISTLQPFRHERMPSSRDLSNNFWKQLFSFYFLTQWRLFWNLAMPTSLYFKILFDIFSGFWEHMTTTE